MSDMTKKEAIKWLKDMRFEDDETCLENKALDIAISSLETDEAYDLVHEQPELCEDCISREATKEAIRKRFPSLHDRCEVNIVINSMPSVLPKAEWIPITERLPEEEEYVLCWLRYGDYMIAKWKYEGWTSEKNVIWVDGKPGTGFYDVVAWMPLPEPYKRGDTDEHN